MQLRSLDGKFVSNQFWYLGTNPDTNKPYRICFFDLESTGFEGNNDYLICSAIKEYKNPKVWTDYITQDDVLSHKFDKELVANTKAQLEKYDIIVTYNGILFDAKMFRTRMMAHGIKPFDLKQKIHFDLYWKVRTLLNLSRSSLKVATKFFGIEGKTDLDFSVWKLASLGDKKVMKGLLEHNRQDVIILEKLFEELRPYCKFDKRSF
jgi:uncharacterized protein YprB with RNaseH-like and TPR domain